MNLSTLFGRLQERTGGKAGEQCGVDSSQLGQAVSDQRLASCEEAGCSSAGRGILMSSGWRCLGPGTT